MKTISERRRQWIEQAVAKDKSYKLMLYNRFMWFALLVLIQIIFFVGVSYLLVYDSAAAIILQTTIGLSALLLVLYLINKLERPSLRLNWILLILIVPVVGVPSFLMFGESRPIKRMGKLVCKSKEETERVFKETYGESEMPSVQDRQTALNYYLAKHGKYPLYTDGDIQYYRSGEEMFPVMLEELEKAEKYILLDYFIIAHGKMWDSMLKILLKKAMQGVKVRIIYDDFGSIITLSPHYEIYLESLHPNIKCLKFNKIIPFFAMRMNNRDHRKILVVDGKVAFTGGINLADEYIAEKVRFGYWKDTGIKITGSAVRSFTAMFFYFWNAFYREKEDIKEYLLPADEPKQDTGIKIQPYDDSPLDNLSIGENVYSDMINRAEKYVYIFTPYLILDDFMRKSLCQAALRGVDVRIVTPGIPDKKTVFRLTRANYELLLKSGVKIYEYTPGFIHAKSVLCDDEWAAIGTFNFDYRSLYLHFENAVYFSGCQAIFDLKKDCEETFNVSKRCTLENTKRGVFGRFLDSILRIFETLM